MIRFPYELGRKFIKGLSVGAHWDELVTLTDQLMTPFIILICGTVISIGLLAIDAQAFLSTKLFLSAHVLMGSVSFHEYTVSLASVFCIAELGRQMFSLKVKTRKSTSLLSWMMSCVGTFFSYVYRYSKALFMAALVFLPVLVMAKVGLDTLGYYGCMYNAQPKSLSVIGMLIGLGLAAVALYAVVFYFFRLSIIFSTYALAFIMQGKGIGESISKGTKLFNAHWAYTAGLMTLFAVIAIGLEYSADHLFALTRHEWINEVKGFALSTLLLLYCALFFSYHKRVSKVPTSR